MLAALIMAGGSGERFWPLSTPKRPKQLLQFFSEKSMIRETVDRILPIIPPHRIFIATNILQAEEIIKELPHIPSENIIMEPAFKDTAAAIGYTTLIIQEKLKNSGEKIEVAVLASDHLITDKEQFCKVIEMGAEEAGKKGVIVTLGIKPTHPETGYGYIEVKSDEPILLNRIYKVRRFREKPNLGTAEEYLASGKFLWNSGMFIFSIDTIFKNFEVLMEEHNQIFQLLKKEIETGATGIRLSEKAAPHFQKFEKISIDFGIMEYSKNIRVIPVDMGWNDIGSFTALAEVLPADSEGNVAKDTLLLTQDAGNNIVIARDMVVSLLGVENLIVVKSENNLLVASKDRAQDIKKIVNKYNEMRK